MTEYLEPISKQEFVDWKHNPVTKRVYSEIAQAMNDVALRLVGMAGKDSANDNYNRGIFDGLRLVLELELEGDTENA